MWGMLSGGYKITNADYINYPSKCSLAFKVQVIYDNQILMIGKIYIDRERSHIHSKKLYTGILAPNQPQDPFRTVTLFYVLLTINYIIQV